MTENELDILLRRSLLDAEKADWKETMDTAPPAEPSLRQRRRMGALLANPEGYARRAARPVWKRAVRTAACFLLACILGFGALLAANPTARADFAQWVREWQDGMNSYSFTGLPSQEELPWYEIGDPLEGYVEGERSKAGGHARIAYWNQEDQRISFRYYWMDKGTTIGAVTDGMNVEEVTVSGYSGEVYLSIDGSESNAIIWMNEGAEIVFLIDAWADKQELLHMAESVYLSDTPK